MKGLSPNNFSTSIFVIEIKYSDPDIYQGFSFIFHI